MGGGKPAHADTRTIMAIGDSLTAGTGLPVANAFPARLEAALQKKGHDVKVINAGVGGETSSGTLTRLEWTLTQKPDYIILEIGGNDMLRAVDPAITRGNIDKILSVIAAHKIPVLVAGMRAFLNLGPSFGASYETMYRDLSKKYGAVYYPFFLDGAALHPDFVQDDGLHPNAAGVEVIVGKMLPSVEKLLSRGPGDILKEK